jgi:hypothetical protein
MKIVKRIKAPTPPENKDLGQVLTVIAVVCTAMLSSGMEFNRVGYLVLIAGASLSGCGAVYHAQKVDNNKLNEEENG